SLPGAARMTISTASFLRQGERDDLVIGDLRPGEPAARAHHGDELPSIGSSVRDRRRFNRRRQLDFPQLLAGRGGKGAEPEVIRAANEGEATCGQHDTAGTGASGLL